jgi:diguanylate cyclase
MLVDDFDLFANDDDAAMSAAVLTNKSLVDTQERLGAMLDVMPMGLLIHTRQGVLFANQEACRLMRVERQGVLGQHFLDFVRPHDLTPVSKQFETSFSQQAGMVDHEVVLVRPDGSERLVRLISGRLPWDGNPVIQILLQDITDQKRAEQSLRQMTITDELTGAYNRRHAFYEAALYIDSESSRSIPLSVILLDVDHFKRINDTYGHGVGDITLRELTDLVHRLLAVIRDADSAIFARIGGEEFVAILPGLTTERSLSIAERLRSEIQNLSVINEAVELSFTVSMGVGTYEPADENFDGLLARCDAALYAAKRDGRNRVCAARASARRIERA